MHVTAAAAFGLASPPRLVRQPLPACRARHCSSPVAMSSASVEFHEGIEALAGEYDAFLIDQWGVMHDGKTVQCLNLDGLLAVLCCFNI